MNPTLSLGHDDPIGWNCGVATSYILSQVVDILKKAGAVAQPTPFGSQGFMIAVSSPLKVR